jgi:RNA polymerase sigma factor (sigma-70 family)
VRLDSEPYPWTPEGGFAAVLAAAQAGDPDAIGAIYRELAPVVIGFMRTNGALNVEDLAEDVFVSMIGALPKFTGDERQFRSWVLTIAYRRRVDELRRMGRRPEDPGLPIDKAEFRTDRGNVEAAALARLDAQGVLDAMSQLTDDQRSVLMLRVLADLPILEISRITGKSEAAVKALLRRSSTAMSRLVKEPERL